MIFKSILLKNYKPFYGKEKINFSGEGGVFLFGAKNGRGKTAILEGIWYCLYQFPDDSTRNTAINRDAAMAGDGEMKLEVVFDRSESTYTISRRFPFEEVDDVEERQVSESMVSVTVESPDKTEHFIEDETAPNNSYERFIDRILPEDVADYFFFDGEKIDDYAKRFAAADTDVRDAIEDVLGLQDIDAAISDLDEYCISKYDQEYTSAKSESRKYRLKKRTIRRKRDKKADLESSKKEYRKSISELQKEREDYKQELSKAQDQQQVYESKVRAETELRGPGHVDRAEEVLKESMINELTPSVNTRINSTIEKQTDIYQNAGIAAAISAAEGVQEVISIETPSGLPFVIRKLIERDPDECFACGQPLEQGRKELIDHLDEVTDESTDEADHLHRVAIQLLETEEVQSTNPDQQSINPDQLAQRAATLSSQLDDLKQKRISLKEQIREYESQLEGSDIENERVSELQEKIQEIEDKIEQKKSKLDETEDDIRGTQSSIGTLQEKLDELEGASEEEEHFRLLRKISEESQEAFEDAKEKYVVQRRKDVQAEAAQIFRSLTHDDKVYEGLSIDEEYRLQLKTSSGVHPIQDIDPSRGERQIIAYSFIAGLSQYTSRDAPLVIDTPIARLDEEHKSNLIDEFPSFSHQVIILYQPNELDEHDITRFREAGLLTDHKYIVQNEDRPAASTIVSAEEYDATIEKETTIEGES